MFRKKEKTALTEQQLAEKERIDNLKKASERERKIALQFLLAFRPEKERNGFVEDFRKAIGDTHGQ